VSPAKAISQTRWLDACLNCSRSHLPISPRLKPCHDTTATHLIECCWLKPRLKGFRLSVAILLSMI